MRISFLEPLALGWHRMKIILLEPFDLAKWLVIGFAAWLAGLMSWSYSWISVSPGEPPRGGDLVWGINDLWQWLADNPLLLPLVGLATLLSLAFFGLLLWLDSRGKMIFLDNVVRNQAAIAEPWQRLRRLGDSLFLWRLGFTLAFLAITLALGLVFLGPAAAAHGVDLLSGLSFAAILLSVLLMTILSVAAAFVVLMVDSFIVPIMYKFQLSATEAWRYLLPWLSRYALSFLLYGLFVLALLLGYSLALTLTCCLCGTAVIPYVGSVLLLPITVTFRLFSLEFLAQLDPAFALLPPATRVPATPYPPVEHQPDEQPPGEQ